MNKKRKILILSRSFYPNNSPRSFRTTELVKEFSRQGHDITLYIQKDNPKHFEFEKEYNIKIKDYGKKRFSILDISQGNRLVVFLKRFINRLLLQFFEYPDIELMFKVREKLKVESKFDLLISIAIPHPIHWGVALARSKKNMIATKWIADCGDPYMGNKLDTFKKFFYFKYVEKWWCRKANYITVPFEGAIKAYYKDFHNKIKVIPQGFNFEDSCKYVKKYEQNKIPKFAYSGAFIRDERDPRKFIKFLLSLDIDFKFIIYTNKGDLVDDLIGKSEGKIERRSYIPRNELIGVLSSMDFIVNVNNSNSTQLPSKLIDYSLTGRPILSIDSTGFNEKKVKDFLSGNYEQQFIIKNIDQYKIENVCNKFLNIDVNQ